MTQKEAILQHSVRRPEDVAQQGDTIYERDIQPRLGADDNGKFVVIDIDTGAYEIDADEVVATDRLLAHHPQAYMWLRQVGSRYARRFGARYREIV